MNRIYILGAGFSAPAGLPLTSQLLGQVHSVASQQTFPDEQTEFGQADWLLEKLQFYHPLAGFSHEMILEGKVPEDFDIEQFVSFVSVESACQLNTGEQWDEHGSQFMGYLKRWIAQAINSAEEGSLLQGVPNFYNRFVELTSSSLVFTFNWDTLLERLLEINGVPYELDSRSNLQPGVLPLFKLHGSIDWFSYPSSVHLQDWMGFHELGNTFEGIYRARTDKRSLAAYYRELLSPWIVVPAYDKVDQIKQLARQWSLLYMFFQSNLEVVVIGLSMREDDYHTRAIIYPQLVQGSREGYIRVKVVDLARSEEEERAIKARFTGVENCKFFFCGFCEEALSFITD